MTAYNQYYTLGSILPLWTSITKLYNYLRYHDSVSVVLFGKQKDNLFCRVRQKPGNFSKCQDIPLKEVVLHEIYLPRVLVSRGIFNQGYLCLKCGLGAHKECLGRLGLCGRTGETRRPETISNRPRRNGIPCWGAGRFHFPGATFRSQFLLLHKKKNIEI